MAEPIHEFAKKLCTTHVAAEVLAGLVAEGAQASNGLDPRWARVGGPLSINLDLTVACNYSCDHCIDLEVLNTPHKLSFHDVLRSLLVLRLVGLRSVILIGGGEPTVYPRFRDVVRVIKWLGLQCAVVSNGSHNDRIADVAPMTTRGDWVRLSLDAGTNSTFVAMHRPRDKRLTLESICEAAERIKEAGPEVSLGYSFIVSWKGAFVNGREICDNIDQIPIAASLAKRHRFDYLSLKPMLCRDDDGAETVSLVRGERRTAPIERIQSAVREAKKLEDRTFRVVESANLTALTRQETLSEMRVQPRRCHLHMLRQVVTPTGTYGCPAYRGNDKARIGAGNAYRSVPDFLLARRNTFELLDRFDASHECRNITCMYNRTNWWLDRVATGDEELPSETESADLFL